MYLSPPSAFSPILVTIPSKTSLHSLIHWFLSSTTIYWAETEREEQTGRPWGGSGREGVQSDFFSTQQEEMDLKAKEAPRADS